VIVYGHHSHRLNVPRFLRVVSGHLDRLPSIPGRDAIVDLLVELGEAYSAVADALCPLRDDEGERLRPWCDALHAVASALCASVHNDGEGVRDAILACHHAIETLAHAPPRGDVSARNAEGFAHYSVYPEQYIVAGERLVDRFAPQALTCIGLRTIGAPLAHAVAAAAERRGVPARVFTVRPRGHPFDRRLELAQRFRRRIRESGATHFAIVDEGPGLSGSSFASAADALSGLGADASQIVLVPSWEPAETALRSQRGRQTWSGHARVASSFEDVFAMTAAEDLSAGRWRNRVLGNDTRTWPAVHPHHERRKYLHISPGGGWVSRFAGLGRYGRAKYRRAERLADAGLSPQPVALTHGFLTHKWIAGTPLTHELAAAPRGLIDRLASYLAVLRRDFQTGRRAGVDDLVEMMSVNIGEGVGRDELFAVDALAHEASRFEEPQVAVDGRMLPHEWLSTTKGLLKVDALDHHADDFFPGSRDIAWDVAGAIVEFSLDAGRAAQLLARYRTRSGDASIAHRLPFYEAAYLAYRLGYTTTAAGALGRTLDGLRFTRLAGRYRRSLARLARPLRSARQG
jgi:hypothetical protein